MFLNSISAFLYCSVFENNTSLEDNQDTSAIAAFRFPTIFSGFNNFTGNIGGGITLLNTRMEASGSLWFEGNRAVFGGGIAMDDRCLVRVTNLGNYRVTKYSINVIYMEQ